MSVLPPPKEDQEQIPKLTVRLTNTFLPIIREIQHMYGGHIYKARKVKEHYLQVYVLSLTR